LRRGPVVLPVFVAEVYFEGLSTPASRQSGKLNRRSLTRFSFLMRGEKPKILQISGLRVTRQLGCQLNFSVTLN
jgi:hypothetical protein